MVFIFVIGIVRVKTYVKLAKTIYSEEGQKNNNVHEID